MNQGDIGSPDSGLGALSPCLSADSGSELTETKNLYFTFDSKMTSKSNCEELKSSDLVVDQSTPRFHEEKLGTRAIGESNRRCSKKISRRRSKSAKMQSVNDDLSPVLGAIR